MIFVPFSLEEGSLFALLRTSGGQIVMTVEKEHDL